MGGSVVVLLTLCVSVCVCSPHSPTAKEQHHTSSAGYTENRLLQQLQRALEERAKHEGEKQEVEEMQWSSANNRLICDRTIFNRTYLSFMRLSFRCCFDRSQRRFCLDHRVPEDNFARPCPRRVPGAGDMMEGGTGAGDDFAASLCIRGNQSSPSFLRNLELCMQDDGMGVCTKGVTVPPCDTIGEEETETETLAQLARESSYIEHRAHVENLLQQLQTELEKEEKTSRDEMKLAQEMQWSRVSNRLYCDNQMVNLTSFSRTNYTFRCCYDAIQRRFCFDETVSMEQLKPCPREPRDDEPCLRSNNAFRIPPFLRRLSLCELTGEGTCYIGTPIKPCNNGVGSASGDTAAIRALLAQYRNN